MLAVVFVALSAKSTEKCFGNPTGIVAAARYGEEYAGATLSSEILSDPVLNNFNISESFSTSHKHAAGVVYKAFNVVFDVNDAPLENISVFPGVTTDDKLLGEAVFHERQIIIYVDNLPNYDAFIAVLIHELLHFMGFGSLAHGNKLSFMNRTSPYTLKHNTSSNVLKCAQKRDESLQQLYADSTQSHWNVSMRAFDNDIMLPFITFDKSLLSECTVLEVLESRPWGHRLCNSDDDCGSETSKCVSLGRHWPHVCRSPLIDNDRESKVAKAQFLIFISVISIIFVGIKACHQRPLDIYAPFVTTKSNQQKYLR